MTASNEELASGITGRVREHQRKREHASRVGDKPAQHGRSDVGADHGYAALQEGKGDATRADADLEARLPARELGGEDVGQSVPHFRREPSGGVVVAGRPVEADPPTHAGDVKRFAQASCPPPYCTRTCQSCFIFWSVSAGVPQSCQRAGSVTTDRAARPMSSACSLDEPPPNSRAIRSAMTGMAGPRNSDGTSAATSSKPACQRRSSW